MFLTKCLTRLTCSSLYCCELSLYELCTVKRALFGEGNTQCRCNVRDVARGKDCLDVIYCSFWKRVIVKTGAQFFGSKDVWAGFTAMFSLMFGYQIMLQMSCSLECIATWWKNLLWVFGWRIVALSKHFTTKTCSYILILPSIPVRVLTFSLAVDGYSWALD